MPTPKSFLCSEHFEEKCFVVRPNKIGRRLNEMAIPSMFNFPSHLQPKQHQPRKHRKHPAESIDSSCVDDQDVPSPTKMARRLNVEHSYVKHDQPAPPEMVEKMQQLKKKIKRLNQKVRRKQHKIEKMANLLKCIEDKKYARR